jgi:hypothetical protein
LIFLPLLGLFISSTFSDIESSNIFEVHLSINGTPEVDLSYIPEIDYNSLNELWYNPKIEMLIISPNNTDFINTLQPLVDWKNEKGVKTIILSNFSLYEGRDDAEKIRNMINSYYEQENIRWVLLAGDAGNGNDEIPIRMVYNPDVKRWTDPLQTESVGGEDYKPTDFYYADLTGSWDSDGDGRWGEAPQDTHHGLDEISWIPEVYVGRFPAKNANELEIMVNKTIKYESNATIGNWMNRMLLAGAISDLSPLEDEAVLTTYIWDNYASNEMEFTHLHRTASPFDPPTPPAPNRQEGLTSTNIKTEMDLGYSTVIIASHGIYSNFQDTYGYVYTESQATNSANIDMPFLLYGDACTTSSYDVNDNSIGEILIKKQNAGAIGYIGGLRVTWYFEDDGNLEKLNRGNAKLFWKEFFLNKKFQQGRALYDSKVAYINSDYYTTGPGSTVYDFERKNLLTYNLLGDPEVDIYTNKPKNAANPFPENIYEGQLVSVIIKDVNGSAIPYARVHFRTSDAKYYTTYADENGIGKFRLPAQANETYNVTITGHNLIPSYFNFTTLPDDSKPEILGLHRLNENPTSSDIINFNIEAYDNYSGIESIYLLLSDNNFENYIHFSISNEILENQNVFTLNTDKFKPGQYSYCIVSRDYANNTQIFQNSSFNFTIPKPVIEYILFVSLIFIVGLMGVSTVLVYKGIRRYSNIFGKME